MTTNNTSELVNIAANILEEEAFTDAASLTSFLLDSGSKFFKDEERTHSIA